jgi:large subunit ribosomal protein L21
MFAVFESGGKQHRVTEGERLRLERLDAEPGAEIEFDRVMMVGDGERISIGQPFVHGGRVKAEVLGHDRYRKIRIIKFRRRKDYLRRAGHRQWFTEVRITGISA